MTIIHKAEQAAMQIIICKPTIIRREVKKRHCPNCHADRPFLVEHLEWYGIDETCLTCGDCWQDGELCPRPLVYAWRKKAVQRALDRLDDPVEEPSYLNEE